MLMLAAAFWPAWILNSGTTPTVSAPVTSAPSVSDEPATATVSRTTTSTSTVGG